MWAGKCRGSGRINMFTHRRLFQIISTITMVIILFSGVPVAGASMVDSTSMAWLWRQPPYDPSHPYPPRPAVEVVAWGGTDKKTIYAAAYPSSQSGIPHGIYRSSDM